MTQDQQFYLVNPKITNELCLRVYHFWVEQWFKTLSQLTDIKKLYSDEYINSHKVASVLNDKEVVGILIINKNNLDCKITQNQRKFEHFNDFTWSKLKKECSSDHFLSFEWLAVHPNYRKCEGFCWSEVLVGLVVEYLKTSNTNISVATTYNKRKVNEISEHFGAYKITQSSNYGVDTDIMFFNKSKLKENPNPEVQKLVYSLWEQNFSSSGDIKKAS